MIWQDWNEFLRMGGYALYVWGSVLMCFAAILIETWMLQRRQVRLAQTLQKQNLAAWNTLQAQDQPGEQHSDVTQSPAMRQPIATLTRLTAGSSHLVQPSVATTGFTSPQESS